MANVSVSHVGSVGTIPKFGTSQSVPGLIIDQKLEDTGKFISDLMIPGPQGPIGPQGPQGIQGPPGPTAPLTTFYLKQSIPASSANPSIPIVSVGMNVSVQSVIELSLKFKYHGASGITFIVQIDGSPVRFWVQGAGGGTQDYDFDESGGSELKMDWLNQDGISPAPAPVGCPAVKEFLLSPGDHVITLVWRSGYCDGSYPGGIDTIYGGTIVIMTVPLVT